MNMNKYKRYAKLLRAARERIKSGENRYICDAINAVDPDGDASALRRWISNLIDGEFSYYEWMLENHPAIYAQMGDDDFRKARLQWVDWMIAEMEQP